MTTKLKRSKPAKPRQAYEWDDERGVVAVGRKMTTQAIQLLHGPASIQFRVHCGKLLVDALNAEVAAAKRKARKTGRSS